MILGQGAARVPRAPLDLLVTDLCIQICSSTDGVFAKLTLLLRLCLTQQKTMVQILPAASARVKMMALVSRRREQNSWREKGLTLWGHPEGRLLGWGHPVGVPLDTRILAGCHPKKKGHTGSVWLGMPMPPKNAALCFEEI